jgi:hypothetical protein
MFVKKTSPRSGRNRMEKNEGKFPFNTCFRVLQRMDKTLQDSLGDDINRAIDQGDVALFHKLTTELRFFREFPTGVDEMNYWDRAMETRSTRMLEYLDRRFSVVLRMFKGKRDLNEVRNQLDYIAEHIPSLLDRAVELFYGDPYYAEPKILPESIPMKQYLLTRGYLPKGRHPVLKRDTTWYMLSTSPQLTSVQMDRPVLDPEPLFHLEVVPRCFYCDLVYIRFDNFSTWNDWMMKGEDGKYGTPEHLDFLEALLWHGQTLDLQVLKRLKHDLIDRWRAGKIKVGAKLREALNLK